MTEHIPTPLATRRLVTKHEELRRKREGTWDPTTMVSQTSPEGAALRAHRASPDKVTDAQPIAIELLKNEAPPKFKAACEFTTEKPQGDGEDHAGLVEVPAGDHSPPHEPTSLPTPKAEPLPPGKEATSEAEKPKTETTPLAAIGGKRGRSGGGQPKKQKPPAGIAKSTPKLCPELMLLVLDALAERPFLYHAANEAGIHRKTLAYWIRRSEAGDDGYDIEWQGITQEISRTLQISDLGREPIKLPRRTLAPKGTLWLRQSSDLSRPCDVQDRPGSRGRSVFKALTPT